MSAPDYARLLDDEVRAFIARTQAFYPPNAVDLPVAEQRRVYDDLCKAFDVGYPDGVRSEDRQADGVPVRIYTCGHPVQTVLYLHGGGFVVGGLDSHDSICAEICAGTGHRVVAVDYRLAPDHKHPAAFEDALCATDWALRAFDGAIVLVGDSAGGNLAAAVCHARRSDPRLRGQLLIYPALGGDQTKGSYVTHAQAPGLTLADIAFYQTIRLDGPAPMDDPSYAPLCDTDVSGLPPTIIVTAACDPLNDDGRLYRDALRAAGSKVKWVEEPGLVHGYLRARHSSERAKASFETIVADIQSLAQAVWPYP